IEERLNSLAQLRRKYGGTLESVIAYLNSATAELSKVDNIEEQIKELETEKAQIELKLAEYAQKISQERHTVSLVLGTSIDDALQQLNMRAARFQTQIRQIDDSEGLLIEGRPVAFDAHGVDQV